NASYLSYDTVPPSWLRTKIDDAVLRNVRVDTRGPSTTVLNLPTFTKDSDFDVTWQVSDDTYEMNTKNQFKADFDDGGTGGFIAKTANASILESVQQSVSGGFDGGYCLKVSKGSNNTLIDFNPPAATFPYYLSDYKYINFAYKINNLDISLFVTFTLNSVTRTELVQIKGELASLMSSEYGPPPGAWPNTDNAGYLSGFKDDKTWRAVTINLYEYLKKIYGPQIYGNAPGISITGAYFYGQNPAVGGYMYLDNFSISDNGMAQSNLDYRRGWSDGWNRWENDTVSAAVSIPSFMKTLTKAEDGETYFFRGTALDNGGKFESWLPDSQLSRITIVKSPPDPPTNLRWEAPGGIGAGNGTWAPAKHSNIALDPPKNRKVRAAWDAPKDGSGILDYYVQIATDENFLKIESTLSVWLGNNTPNYEFIGNDQTRYYFRVLAKNNAGFSKPTTVKDSYRSYYSTPSGDTIGLNAAAATPANWRTSAVTRDNLVNSFGWGTVEIASAHKLVTLLDDTFTTNPHGSSDWPKVDNEFVYDGAKKWVINNNQWNATKIMRSKVFDLTGTYDAAKLECELAYRLIDSGDKARVEVEYFDGAWKTDCFEEYTASSADQSAAGFQTWLSKSLVLDKALGKDKVRILFTVTSDWDASNKPIFYLNRVTFTANSKVNSNIGEVKFEDGFTTAIDATNWPTQDDAVFEYNAGGYPFVTALPGPATKLMISKEFDLTGVAAGSLQYDGYYAKADATDSAKVAVEYYNGTAWVTDNSQSYSGANVSWVNKTLTLAGALGKSRGRIAAYVV
ncbi:MAG TPA: fibronectin type III domain-containing protein, partial [Candidatus Wallbacteria bacterium]|nr:fibronectin type III domain-containing protein [Candidatus Wallbacteria bacterium]